jgi:hypothetical protein
MSCEVCQVAVHLGLSNEKAVYKAKVNSLGNVHLKLLVEPCKDLRLWSAFSSDFDLVTAAQFLSTNLLYYDTGVVPWMSQLPADQD